MKLISMVEFVLNYVQTPNINEAISLEQTQDRLDKIYQYALFLSQPLTLGMFVPCDLEGNVLEQPHNFGVLNLYPTGDKIMDESFKPAIAYLEAKERVLFEGFEWNGNFAHTTDYEIGIDDETCASNIVEVFVRSGLTLTQSAIKQIGG